ncbi:MAG: hypothetical protein M3220_16130 [Chloroflexota bacterium]|nr:hypothetical protein [Chloroflexota bacterium]
MSWIWLVAIALLILLVGGVVLLLASRREESVTPQPPAPGIAEMGYGTQRWKRELALWCGTLRRLEIQAKHQDPVSEGLQQQIEEAKARIAEAEQHLEPMKEA